ncbi:MAG: hypothetical protein R2682_05540 [Pyrinomonadaceae bacterium]
MHLELAIKMDQAMDYAAAIEQYEAEIGSNPLPPVEAFVNLAFIYWHLATEPPFAFPADISDTFSVNAGNRYGFVLDKGIVAHPYSLELHFWQRYFAHVLFGEPFSPEACEELLDRFKADESLTPYFFLWLYDKTTFAPQRQALIDIACACLTEKNRYILAVLHGTCN